MNAHSLLTSFLGVGKVGRKDEKQQILIPTPGEREISFETGAVASSGFQF